MARQKVKLAFIVNDSQRKATFKKRRKGLMKKVSELSTLCGIDACAIIYSPYENQPDVWPNHLGVHRVLEQFRRMPEMEQNKKMVNNEGFIRQRTVKANEQLKKQLRDNREKDVTMLMYQCLAGRGLQNLMMPDLNDLGWLIDQNLKEINKRIETLKKAPMQEGESSKTAAANVALRQEERQGVASAGDEGIQRPQWFTEWMNATSEQIGFGHGDGAMMPFNDANNHGNFWPGSFFP
ncbi:hypothetical protein Leryth_023109 [Lithospermum erythrorhizon]|uniref:MADS box transcription factor n=1 Tax=Lithospermum erythrorhizon TaxID=34254 RepID=A0AAV3NL48_LITER|nr:hypothetical protein Leryth_023109 [Lithospermum erythrorhizon]